MDKKTRLKLAKLIEENPDMDIITPVLGDDLYEDGLWILRDIERVEIEKWTDEVSDERIFFEYEEDEIKEYYLDCICEDEDLTDEEYDQKADEYFKSINWKENIIVYVS